MVRTAQQASPAELPTVLERYAEAMGMGRAVVYLADLQQRLLLPLVEGESDLEVDASLAGWAYRTNSLRVEEDTSGGLAIWLPLVDGAERLGVLELRMETLDGLKLWRCRAMASLLAMIITDHAAVPYSGGGLRLPLHPVPQVGQFGCGGVGEGPQDLDSDLPVQQFVHRPADHSRRRAPSIAVTRYRPPSTFQISSPPFASPAVTAVPVPVTVRQFTIWRAQA
ncbi:hypothetical protein ACFYRC_12715 [Streptomyces sp. NPDC005279]|uniref:hypothetical protein n=1 Tax=Streptomyces sp. NPDC005279 TaxID=3364712 RepID=UPI00369E0887